MKKTTTQVTVLFLALLMTLCLCAGCGKKKEYELTSRGESLIFATEKCAISGDLSFAFDDGYEMVSFSKSSQVDENEKENNNLSFSIKKDLDEGTVAITGTMYLGSQEAFMSEDLYIPDEEDYEFGVEEAEAVLTPKDFAQLRLSEYDPEASLTDTKIGDYKLWQGKATSEGTGENSYQFYEMCVGGDIEGKTFYMSINGVANNCKDQKAALAAISDTADKLWNSLKIEKTAEAPASLLKDNAVVYMKAAGKTVAAMNYDIASMEEATFNTEGNTVDGAITFNGYNNGIYLDGTLKLYIDSERFENAKAQLSELSKETKKNGHNITWQVMEEDSESFIATAETNGAYLICQMSAGSEDADAQAAAYKNCMDWLLGLEVK